MISLTQILMQQGYITYENYEYTYQLQQSQPLEYRKPLAQMYLELGLLNIEHIEYALNLKQEYLMNGAPPEFQEQQVATPQQTQQPISAQQPVGNITCKKCFSECNGSWAICPFCGSALN